MQPKDWITIGSAIIGPILLFVFGYIRFTTKFETKFETHEESDKRMFETLTQYSGEFFDRITKLEISSAEKTEALRNLAMSYHDIKLELNEIKSILLRNYKL